MSSRDPLTTTEILQAVTVEVIRRLWDRGMYRNNKWLQMCHDNWFDIWVDWKTEQTMNDVDRQVKELNPEPVDFAEPVYWEESEGETPLGGAMGISHDFTSDHEA